MPEQKVELRRKTKDVIMSLYKDGPQLVDLTDPLLVSTINESEFVDVSEFDPVHSGNEMSIYSTVDTIINKTDHPNGLPDLNHKNVTTQRVSQKVATKKASVEPIVNDETIQRKHRLTRENL